MGDEEKQSESAKPETGIEITSPEKAREKFVEKFDEKIEEMLDKVDEAFDEKISKLSRGDRAESPQRGRLIKIRDRQKDEIRSLRKGILDEYDKRVKEVSREDLDKLADEMVNSLSAKAGSKVKEINILMKRIPESEKMTVKETVELDKAFEALKKLKEKMKQKHGDHGDFDRLFQVLGDGGKLEKEDYEAIIDMMNPEDLSKQTGNTELLVERSTTGLFIILMSPAQRYELMELFIESDKKEHAPEVIDGLLQAGVLTRFQGKKLFEQAGDTKYKEKIEGSYYQDQQRKLEEAVNSKDIRTTSQRSCRNIVDRYVGMPMVHTALVAWGGLTALLNFAASWEKGDFGKTLSNFATSYGPLGLAGAGLGLEGLSSTIHKGEAKDTLEKYGIGGGVVSRWIDSLLSDEDRKDTTKRNAARLLAETYSNAPTDLMTYMDKGGFATIHELASEERKEREKAIEEGDDDKKIEPKVTLEKLIEREDDPGQKAKLEGLKARNARADKPIDKALFTIAATSLPLGITTKEKMEEQLKKIRESQIQLKK